MDLSDLDQHDQPRQPVAAPPRQQPFDPHGLVAQFGREVARPLTLATERVAALAASGAITRADLLALGGELERARRVAIVAQQVARLAQGGVDTVPVRLDLVALLREALQQRARDLEQRGLEVRHQFAPASARCDATLLFALLHTLLDWSFEHAHGRIDLQLELSPWPSRAQLRMHFAYRPADAGEPIAAVAPDRGEPALDSLDWRLAQQSAATLGLDLQRLDGDGRTALTLSFPDTVTPSLRALQGHAACTPGATAPRALQLAGHQVLALAVRLELRNLVREALRPAGVLLDFAASIDEARSFCGEGLPHALIYEDAFAGEAFEQLRRQLQQQAPQLAFVRIVDDGRAFELRQVGGRTQACVGRDAIVRELRAALQFELERAA